MSPDCKNVTRGVDIDSDEQTVTAYRKLRRSGGSTVITIPPEMADMMDLEEGDQMKVEGEWSGTEIRLTVATDEGTNGE